MIGIELLLALQALHQQPETNLHVLHATLDNGYPPLLVGLPPLLHPRLIQLPYVIEDVLVAEVQIVEVPRVKEPEFRRSALLQGDEAGPVVGDAHHYGEHQQLAAVFVARKVTQLIVELTPAVFITDDIPELELPGVVHVLDLGVPLALSEPVEVGLAHIIVSPLEIPVQNIPVSPRPFIFKVMVRPIRKQKPLNAVLELPEGCRLQDIILIGRSLKQLQAANTRETRMIPTEVGGVLLVASSMMHVVGLQVLRRQIFTEGR